jgi:hypothetical protein
MHTQACLRLIVVVSLAATLLLVPLLERVTAASTPATPLASQPDRPSASVIYTVTAQGDTTQTAGCASGTANCTLRGALALANNAGVPSLIHFDPNMNGKPITLTNSLVLTGSNISIAGNGSEQIFVNAATNRPAFRIESNSNSIDSLAVVGDGAVGGVLQDGVQIFSGTLNYILNLSLYNLGGQGLNIEGAGSNYVYNNLIGVYKVGGVIATSCLLPNRQWGLVLHSPSNSVSYNTIGCNLIDGVIIANSGSNYNLLYGNYIGVTKPYTTIANTAGVVLVNGAFHNQIGDKNLDPNVIAGNTQNGMYIGDPNTDANQVVNNYIGAVPLPPNSTIFIGNAINGIWLNNGAHDTVIGGNLVTETNQIGGNHASGILILNSPNNQVLRNDIILNGAFGVLLDGITTTGTLISATQINNSGYPVNNGGSGIRERNGAANNVWSHVRSYYNHGMGIDKDPTANKPDGPFPVITSAIKSGGIITVAGTASPSIFLASTRVELYRVIVNPNAFVDGYVYLATTGTDMNGNWTLTVPTSAGACFVAFQTRFLVFLNTSASSEFGPTNCRAYLPLIVK